MKITGIDDNPVLSAFVAAATITGIGLTITAVEISEPILGGLGTLMTGIYGYALKKMHDHHKIRIKTPTPK